MARHGPAVIRFAPMGLPKYLHPEAFEQSQNLITDISMSVGDLVTLYRTSPATLRNPRTKQVLPSIPENVQLWIVPDSAENGCASSRHGATDKLGFDTVMGRIVIGPDEYWEVIDMIKDRCPNVLLPVEHTPYNTKVGNNRSRRMVKDAQLYYRSGRSGVRQYCPVMTFDNIPGRKASVDAAKESTNTFAGYYLDGLLDGCGGDRVLQDQIKQLKTASDAPDNTASEEAGLQHAEIVVSVRGGFGSMLELLSLDVDMVQLGFPSEMASDYDMMLMKIIPSSARVCEYFGFEAPYFEPRATAVCIDAQGEADALDLVLKAEDIDLSNVRYRTLNMKNPELARNLESATCLTAILKHVGQPQCVVSKDYSFGALHHMATCNEPNVLHILEWHNWTLIGLFFKLAAQVKKLKGNNVFKQYLQWVGLVNDTNRKAVIKGTTAL